MASVFYIELGKLLQSVRLDNKMSQQDVADRMKVSRSTIANWETGRRVINIDDLFKICEIFNVDPNILTNQVKRYLYK